MTPLQLTAVTLDRPAMIAEILPLFRLHSRIVNTDEDSLLERYIGAAISAAENYLLRDVWPTTRVWTGDLCVGSYLPGGYPWSGPGYYPSALTHADWPPAFIVRRGRARTITITDGNGPVDPATYGLLSSADPKTWGFQLFARGADLIGLTITAALGWLTFADMPDDLQEFILAGAGAMYEVRELANYGGGMQAVSTAAFMPEYLLDSWANLTYA